MQIAQVDFHDSNRHNIMNSIDLANRIKGIQSVFFGSKVIVITPDRSDCHKQLIEQLKSKGVAGIWRVGKIRKPAKKETWHRQFKQ